MIVKSQRLTIRDEFGNADIIGVDMDLLNLDFDGLNQVTEALNRLADYEDTGLAPSAVVALKDKATAKPPIPDENATGIDGKPVPRCQVCGYALDLRMEQYCPCCGQRLTEYEVDE